MTREEIRKHSGFMACARVMLARGYDERQWSDEEPATVDRCVKVAFDGDWNAFAEWADSYLAGGCGAEG